MKLKSHCETQSHGDAFAACLRTYNRISCFMEVSMSQPRVLCVSFDETVSRMRVAALSAAGYDVTGMTKISEALALKSSPAFNIVVIGHRLDEKGKESLINKARTDWKAKVILVCGASNDSELHVDKRVYGLEGVEGIVAKAHELAPVAAHM